MLNGFTRRALLSLVLLALPACLSIKPQVETGWIKNYVIERGGVRVQYEAGLASCWRASKAAVDRLGLSVEEETPSRKISGIMKDGTRFDIGLESPGREWTEIRVKIGMLGDEKRSMQIHTIIAEELSALATTVLYSHRA